MQRATCADCMIGCEKRHVSPSGIATRIEYENVFALGALLDVWDTEAVLAASRLCDHYGLDTISTGGTLAFAAECAERGLLDVPVRFGDAAGLLDAIGHIARREGYGALLARGSRALAAHVGGDSADFAPHVKGLELPGYHPAGLQTLGLGLAVGARGADHNKSGAYDLDLSGDVDRFALDSARIAAMVELEDQAVLIDSLILCKFVRRALDDVYGESARMLAALTGEAVTGDTLRGVAADVHDLKKLFNRREGWHRDEDVLPARFYRGGNAEGAGSGHGGIDRAAFAAARAAYYRLRGWDTAGCSTPDPALLRLLDPAATTAAAGFSTAAQG